MYIKLYRKNIFVFPDHMRSLETPLEGETTQKINNDTRTSEILKLSRQRKHWIYL